MQSAYALLFFTKWLAEIKCYLIAKLASQFWKVKIELGVIFAYFLFPGNYFEVITSHTADVETDSMVGVSLKHTFLNKSRSSINSYCNIKYTLLLSFT